jgi:hypothetical protein
MKQIKLFLGKWGIHSFLLPVFFVSHSYIQYYGLVSAGVAAKIFAIIIGITLLFYLSMLALTKNMDKSSQLTTLTFFVFLFYGIIKDFIGITLRFTFLAKYVVLLPLVIFFTIALYINIFKKNSFFKINLFENLLLSVFIIADAVSACVAPSGIFLNRNLLVRKDVLNVSSIATPDERPDVYFLLFDSYPATDFLRQYLQFDNSRLDSILIKKGFKVINKSRSNYNRTAFSLTSELNFEYLKDLTAKTKLTAQHYNRALLTIKDAVVPEVFLHLGYKMYNLSSFELANQVPIYRESFLTSSEENVLLYNTLPGRIRNDILWNFITGIYVKLFHSVNGRESVSILLSDVKKRDFNNKIADSVVHIPADPAVCPKFIYAHFYLPHPPYFYNENGVPNELKRVTDTQSFFSKKYFFPYLKYTNKIIIQTVDSILAGSRKPPVIIIQSDHSSIDYEGCPNIKDLCFNNYTAFYFPDKQYEQLHDTLSNINTFPLIFNKYFKLHISLKKDSSFYLDY